MVDDHGKRKRRGRPPLPPERRRTQSVDVEFSPIELAEVLRRARADDEELRPFIRDAALNRRARPRRETPAPELLALAEATAAVAQDLRTLCIAIAAGRLLGAPPELLERLRIIANATGLRLLGVAPDGP